MGVLPQGTYCHKLAGWAMDKPDELVLETCMADQGRIDTRPHFPEIDLLSVSAEDLRFWHWDWPEGDPFWRLYWNTAPGACVTWRKRDHLTPDSIMLIAPHTPIRLRLNGVVGHLFMHFVVAPPFHPIHTGRCGRFQSTGTNGIAFNRSIATSSKARTDQPARLRRWLGSPGHWRQFQRKTGRAVRWIDAYTRPCS